MADESNRNKNLVDTDITFGERTYDTSGGDYPELGYAIKGSDLTGNPGGEASTFGVDSTGLKNVAVLGPNTSDSNSYTLEISAESLKQGWKLESADIVLKYNSELFKEITLEDIELTVICLSRMLLLLIRKRPHSFRSGKPWGFRRHFYFQ